MNATKTSNNTCHYHNHYYLRDEARNKGSYTGRHYIIIILITFTHDIYNYTHKTNHVSTVYSFCSHSVATIYGTCNDISNDKHFVLPHQHFPQYVLSVQYGCFLQFLNFVLSGYVAQVMYERFWDGYSRPCYYRYQFCLCIPHALYFYCEAYILECQILLLLLLLLLLL